MKYLTHNSLVLTAVCMTGLSLALDKTSETVSETVPSQFKVNHVDAVGARALLEARPETVVLDIRTPKEIDKGYIEGAKFADFFEDNFSEKLA